MFGPIFASPSFAELREQPKIATPAPTLRRGSRGRRDGLGTLLHLGCIALVSALTVWVFFGLAFYFLAHPIDEVIAISGARHRLGEASLPMVVPAAAPVVRVGGAPAPQPMRAGPTGQPERAAALVATVAGLAVAIPALFGYNYLLARIKDVTSEMQVFIDEFITKTAESYHARSSSPTTLAAE